MTATQDLGHSPVPLLMLKFSSFAVNGGSDRVDWFGEETADHVQEQQAALPQEVRHRLVPPPLISWSWAGKMGIK